MTKTHVKAFFPEQYDMMMQTLTRAFLHNENNSLLLLARSKQTLNALTSQVQKDIQKKLTAQNDESEFKVVTINCTLNNSENKMV